MSAVSTKIKILKRVSLDNSPAILTAIGVTGALSTAILSFRAGREVDYILSREDAVVHVGLANDPILTRKDKFRLTWQCYIPPATACSVTIGSLIMVNRIGTKRAAALAAAVTISEKAFVDYKDKVVDILGEKEDERVRRAVAQDRVNDNPLDSSKIIMVGESEVLFHDSYSGRYFMSTMETVRRAQNDINEQVLHEEIAPLTTFYTALGIPETSASDEVGWNMDKLLHVKFNPILSTDNKPCIDIEFSVMPVRNYWRPD